jgi:hypothetical protein
VAGQPQLSNINGCDNRKPQIEPTEFPGNPTECRTFRTLGPDDYIGYERRAAIDRCLTVSTPATPRSGCPLPDFLAPNAWAAELSALAAAAAKALRERPLLLAQVSKHDRQREFFGYALRHLVEQWAPDHNAVPRCHGQGSRDAGL